jgi:hypothetical protein
MSGLQSKFVKLVIRTPVKGLRKPVSGEKPSLQTTNLTNLLAFMITNYRLITNLTNLLSLGRDGVRTTNLTKLFDSASLARERLLAEGKL